jgi:proteasome lid subunit RPN8/RPN11
MDQSTNSNQPALQSLRISPAIWLQIRDHLREWLPNEGCGLLAGSISHDGVGIAIRFFPGFNVLHSPTRFRMADAEIIDAFRAMREGNLALIAIVHSHPRTAPRPSGTDLAELHYPEAAMLIVGFGAGEAEPAAWRVDAMERDGVRPIVFSIDSEGSDGCVSL